MAKGKLIVTLVYSYETDTDDYETRSYREMAEQDIEQDPTIILASGDWRVKGATFEKEG
jgi:hypothetical protein